MLINQFVHQLFASAFSPLTYISEACYITFVTLPVTKTCVDQSELVNVGAQIDKLIICKLLFTNTQLLKLSKASGNNSSANINLSRTQLRAI